MSPFEVYKKYPISNMDWKYDDVEHQFHNHLQSIFEHGNPTYDKSKLRLLIDTIRDPWYRQFPSKGRQSGNGTLRLIMFDTTVEGNLIECICFLEF